MSVNLEFKRANKNDAEQVTRLVNSAYRGDSSRKGWTTEADLLGGQRTDFRAIQDLIQTPEQIILLAKSNGQLVACAQLEKKKRQKVLGREQGANSNVCYFGMFAVDPNLQNKGVGKLFLNEAERFAREEWQCDLMEITVITLRKELIEYYERRGFSRTGETRDFPVHDERFGLPKTSELVLGVWQKALG